MDWSKTFAQKLLLEISYKDSKNMVLSTTNLGAAVQEYPMRSSTWLRKQSSPCNPAVVSEFRRVLKSRKPHPCQIRQSGKFYVNILTGDATVCKLINSWKKKIIYAEQFAEIMIQKMDDLSFLSSNLLSDEANFTVDGCSSVHYMVTK